MVKSPVLKKPGTGPRPVPPDAVRVWRGFRLPTLTPADFLTALGTIFIPVTAQLQSLYGLTAYLPTVLPTGKPAGVPDEIALVFYETQKAYNDMTLIVAGRAYSSLHKTVFAFPASLSSFPILLGREAITVDQPYYLFTKSVDWEQGFTQVFVGARPANVNVTDFVAKLTRFLQSQQRRPAPGLDGAIACVSNDYVVYWEHWNNEGQSLQGSISDLPNLATRILLQPYAKQAVDGSLTDHYAGLSQVECKSFNITWKG
jgi:hypothetical protein